MTSEINAIVLAVSFVLAVNTHTSSDTTHANRSKNKSFVFMIKYFKCLPGAIPPRFELKNLFIAAQTAYLQQLVKSSHLTK